MGNVDKKGHNSLWGRVYSPEGLSVTLKAEGGGLGAKTGLYEIDDLRIRRLTPRECERLMGIPDDWTKWYMQSNGNVRPVSDTQRYRMCGNGVVPQVVTEILRRLI